MASLIELNSFLDSLLELPRYAADASNNGIQFQGTDKVEKAVFAVDACEAVFHAAADLNADFIFVHHGISWGPGIKRIQDFAAKRITILAANGMSLYAAHLPLDANDTIGHNALLAKMMKLKKAEPFGTFYGLKIGFHGALPKAVTLEQLAALFDKELASCGDFQMFGDPQKKIKHPAVISGGGACPEVFSEMTREGADCLVTGELTHPSYHYAAEAGVQVLTLGHYRSETPGVLAVMNKVQEQFKIDCEFIDCPTGL